MIAPSTESITGVILAGGAGRRMGGLDKGLVDFAGRPLVEWAIEALAPQVEALLISANRNIETYASYGFDVIPDPMPGFQGPLAGILGAMRAADSPWILTLPCDAPRTPPDLGRRLSRALIEQRAELCVASDGERRHNLHALLPTALAADLAEFLASGERKVQLWQARHRLAVADLGDCPNAFLNLNTNRDTSTHGRCPSGSE